MSHSNCSAAASLLILALTLHASHALPHPPTSAPRARAYSGALQRPSTTPKLAALRGGASPTVPGLTVSLVKNMVGSAVLSLAGGIAAFSDEPHKAIPATILFTLIAALGSGYCFYLVGKVCLMTGATTYKDAWARSIGEGTVWVPAAFVSFKTLVACLCFAIIIGDLGRDLAVTAGFTGRLAQRETVLFFMMSFVILPLCLLRSFSALAATAYLGMGGILVTAAVMIVRLFDGSYKQGGKHHDTLAKAQKDSMKSTNIFKTDKRVTEHFLPTFNGKTGTRWLKSLILVSSLTSSFLAHYNAPIFLREVGGGINREARFKQVTLYGFTTSFCINMVYAIAGFLTFGGASKGLILNNYASSDNFATVSRIGVLLSIVFGFPFSYVGFRDAALQMLPAALSTSQQVKDATAVAVVAVLTGTALVLSDLGVVVALFGALLGSCVIYVFPALMYMAALKTKAGSGPLPPEYWTGAAVAASGVVAGTLGVGVVVVKNWFPHLIK